MASFIFFSLFALLCALSSAWSTSWRTVTPTAAAKALPAPTPTFEMLYDPIITDNATTSFNTFSTTISATVTVTTIITTIQTADDQIQALKTMIQELKETVVAQQNELHNLSSISPKLDLNNAASRNWWWYGIMGNAMFTYFDRLVVYIMVKQDAPEWRGWQEAKDAFFDLVKNWFWVILVFVIRNILWATYRSDPRCFQRERSRYAAHVQTPNLCASPWGLDLKPFIPKNALNGPSFSYPPSSGPNGGNQGLWDILYYIRVNVTNTGPIVGDEVPQLYVSLGGPYDPKVVLRGFERVTIDPGKTVQVTFPLARRDLASWDTEKQDWVISEYVKTVYVGSSSRDLPLGTVLEV
ncbi:hypothetical protein KCU73_g2642, partial [Aureobasidium melanogenum]